MFNKFKTFFYIIIINFLIFNNLYAKLYKTGDIIENKITLGKNFKINISEGKWVVVDKYSYSYFGLVFKGNWIAKVINNELMEFIIVEKAQVAGLYINLIDSALHEIVFKNKYSGCYERPEYYVLEVYNRGSSHNCFRAGHLDILKEFSDPYDPEDRGSYSKVNYWLKKNNIKIPPIVFHSHHSYFSRLARGEWYVVNYIANPKIYNSPKMNFFTRDTSEYHKYNIEKFPEHKKAMKKWISISAKNHKILEKLYKAKDIHLLDLESYIFEIENFSTETDIVQELEKLNELFKSGVITEQEFKKAKKKILN